MHKIIKQGNKPNECGRERDASIIIFKVRAEFDNREDIALSNDK